MRCNDAPGGPENYDGRWGVTPGEAAGRRPGARHGCAAGDRARRRHAGSRAGRGIVFRQFSLD